MAKSVSKPNVKKLTKLETNKYDVMIRFIDKSYNLLNSGNFIGIIIAAIIILVLYLAHRCSDGFIEASLKSIFDSVHFPSLLVVFPLVASVGANYIQHKVYIAEIKRLTQIRKELMHGHEHGSLNKLDNHTSSNFNLLED